MWAELMACCHYNCGVFWHLVIYSLNSWVTKGCQSHSETWDGCVDDNKYAIIFQRVADCHWLGRLQHLQYLQPKCTYLLLNVTANTPSISLHRCLWWPTFLIQKDRIKWRVFADHENTESQRNLISLRGALQRGFKAARHINDRAHWEQSAHFTANVHHKV